MSSDARAAILALLSRRPADATVCPSEVARALVADSTPSEWRSYMPAVHAAVDLLAADGRIALSWKGKPKTGSNGPYRIRTALSDRP